MNHLNHSPNISHSQASCSNWQLRRSGSVVVGVAVSVDDDVLIVKVSVDDDVLVVIVSVDDGVLVVRVSVGDEVQVVKGDDETTMPERR